MPFANPWLPAGEDTRRNGVDELNGPMRRYKKRTQRALPIVLNTVPTPVPCLELTSM
jgi:hypothetical protein